MHELSIALNIIEIVQEEAKKNNANTISEITLEIGTLSGVVEEALEFALEEAVKNTILENSSIKLIKKQAKAKCEKCGNVFETNDYYSVCPNCSHPYTDIIDGKELCIKKITID
ncbi:MAG: hydrogenase maturation nickel metallochaperone HypA [Marinilabiliales bacterium]